MLRAVRRRTGRFLFCFQREVQGVQRFKRTLSVLSVVKEGKSREDRFLASLCDNV